MEDDTQSAKPFVLTTVTVSALKRTDGKMLCLTSPPTSSSAHKGTPPAHQHFTGRALPPMVAIVSLQAVLRHHTSQKRMNLQLNVLRVKRYLQWFTKYSSRLESSSVLFGSNLTGVLPSFHTETKKDGLKVLDSVFQALLPPNAKGEGTNATINNKSSSTGSANSCKYFYIPHNDMDEKDGATNTLPAHPSANIRTESDKTALDALLAKFEEVTDSDIPAPPTGQLFPANTIEQLPNTRLLSEFIHDITGRTLDRMTGQGGFMVEVHKIFPKAVVVVSELPPGSGFTATVVLQFMCAVETPCLIALLNDHLQCEASGGSPLPDSKPVNLLRHRATGKFYALLTPVHMHVLYALMLLRRWALEERCRRYSTGSSLRGDQDDAPTDMSQIHARNSSSKYVPQAFDAKGGRLDMITPHQLQVEAVESGVEVVLSTTARVIANSTVSSWRGMSKRSNREGGSISDLQFVTAPLQLGSSAVLDNDVSSADIVSTLLLNQSYGSSSNNSTAASASSSSTISSGFRAATTKALSDIGGRQTLTRNRLEGSLYGLNTPAVTGAACTVSSVGHLAISPLAHIQHAPHISFAGVDASDSLHFFTTPLFTKGDINNRGVFTIANGCLPSIEDGSSNRIRNNTGSNTFATNPYPLRFLYLDPLQTDVRAVQYVHLSQGITNTSTTPTRRADLNTTSAVSQPPTIVDLCSNDAAPHTCTHVPYGLLYNPLHQLTSVARYAIEGVEASRIRRCVLGSIGNIAVKLVEHTNGAVLTGSQRAAVETQASLLFLSCHSATKDELASYTTMMAMDIIRVAEAAGVVSISNTDRLSQFLRAIPGIDRSHTTIAEYTPSTLKSLAVSAYKGTDLPTCFYLASAFAFHFCGGHAWWISSSTTSTKTASNNNTTTNNTWVLLQDLITLLGELTRWYEGRHDCHFALISPDDSEKATRMFNDVVNVNQDESINISLHPADYGVIVKGYRDAFNPFRDLPDALSLISDSRLFEATKRMRPSGDVSATASELYQGLVEDLGGMPFHELGERIQEPPSTTNRREEVVSSAQATVTTTKPPVHNSAPSHRHHDRNISPRHDGPSSRRYNDPPQHQGQTLTTSHPKNQSSSTTRRPPPPHATTSPRGKDTNTTSRSSSGAVVGISNKSVSSRTTNFSSYKDDDDEGSDGGGDWASF